MCGFSRWSAVQGQARTSIAKRAYGPKFEDIFPALPPHESDTPMHRRLAALAVGLGLGLSSMAVWSPSATAAAPLTARTVTMRATPSSPTSGSTVTIAGVLSGSPARSTVKVQQLRSGSWVTLSERSTGSTGGYSYTFHVTATGSRTYRAFAQATPTLGSALSARRSITVVAKPRYTFKTV